MANLKSLGGFDIVVNKKIKDDKLIYRTVRMRHRVMVTVDAELLAHLMGPKATSNKSRKSRICGGAIEVVDLGGVEVQS